MSIQALREQLSLENRAAKALLAEKGDRVWSAEDQAKFDGHMDNANRLNGQIKAHQRMLDLEAEATFDDARKQGSKGSKSVDIDALAAVALYMRHGNDVSADQAVAIRNAMSTTSSPEGGYTVPSEVASMVVDAMKAFGGMREVSDIISTEGGNPMNWPTSDGTAEVGEIVAENAAATTGEMTFGTVAVNPYKYSSKKLALPWELISDSAVDVVAFVVNRLSQRLGRISNAHFTTGDASAKPAGVVTRATAGKVGTTGQTLTVIFDDLFDLKHSVNRAYRNGSRFMMNDASVAIVSKIKETTGRPIWEPAVTAGAPDVLLGYPVTINDDMPVMAADARSILFGNFTYYKVRDVQGSVILRRFDDSAFALNGQVGFCGWLRTGGNLVDTAAVKYYQNSAA